MISKQKITMTDVAKAAGVTQSTVSHVINKSAPVSDELRARVLHAIHTLGYRPNIMAKNLKTKQSNVIGLMVPNVCIPFFAEIASTIESVIRNDDYVLILCNTFYHPEMEQKYVSTLLQYNAAGIIVSYGVTNPAIYEDILNSKTSVVTLDDKTSVDATNIPSIETNNYLGSRLAVSHLAQIGAERICYASEPIVNSAFRNRFNGYKDALHEFGYEFDDSICFIENNNYDLVDVGYNIGAKIVLDRSIDAVFASNDQLACGIMNRLREYNVRIPHDVAIIGYDNAPWSKYISPALSTISQQITQMARLGANLILKLIRNENVSEEERSVVLDPSLIIRASTLRVNKQ